MEAETKGMITSGGTGRAPVQRHPLLRPRFYGNGSLTELPLVRCTGGIQHGQCTHLRQYGASKDGCYSKTCLPGSSSSPDPCRNRDVTGAVPRRSPMLDTLRQLHDYLQNQIPEFHLPCTHATVASLACLFVRGRPGGMALRTILVPAARKTSSNVAEVTNADVDVAHGGDFY